MLMLFRAGMQWMSVSGEVDVRFNVSIILHWTRFSRFFQYLILCFWVLRELGEFTLLYVCDCIVAVVVCFIVCLFVYLWVNVHCRTVQVTNSTHQHWISNGFDRCRLVNMLIALEIWCHKRDFCTISWWKSIEVRLCYGSFWLRNTYL